MQIGGCFPSVASIVGYIGSQHHSLNAERTISSTSDHWLNDVSSVIILPIRINSANRAGANLTRSGMGKSPRYLFERFSCPPATCGDIYSIKSYATELLRYAKVAKYISS